MPLTIALELRLVSVALLLTALILILVSSGIDPKIVPALEDGGFIALTLSFIF